MATALTKRTYPFTTIVGGRNITFRMMNREDLENALKFAKQVPEEDLLFLSLDITNREAMMAWADSIEAGRSITILAEIDGRFVGYSSLTHNQLEWTRHLGEIRVMVSRDVRGVGLGKLLVNEIFVIAQEMKLQKLVAQMAFEQRGAIQVFEHLGFKPEALLADHVIDRNGVTHDLVIMSYDVKGFTEE
jgi:RimJ/RimL family protein N-acetyltransferase